MSQIPKKNEVTSDAEDLFGGKNDAWTESRRQKERVPLFIQQVARGSRCDSTPAKAQRHQASEAVLKGKATEECLKD